MKIGGVKGINYQRALRDVAKSMVRLKRPERLLRMITRYIDRELGLTHTSLVLLDEERHRYTFIDSKGRGRIPASLIRFDLDHPLVLWFQRNGRHPHDYLYRPLLKRHTRLISAVHPPSEVLVKEVGKAMDDLKVELAIPGYFKKTLLGLMLLGCKTSHRAFTDEEISFFQILVQDCSMAAKTAEYHQNLLRQNEELAKRVKEIEALRKKEQDTFYEILLSLAQEVFAKDAYTFGHVRQVERLGLLTAKEMNLDLSGRGKDILSAGLVLHDVGKIGIPDRVLNKPGPLDPAEWEIMKTHVQKGADILSHMTDFRQVAEIVRCHHENFDGSGYPRGLKGDKIPIQSRIVSVVDAFHAIVSNRCYRQGRPVEVAFAELRRCAGTQFDPVVVEALIRAIQRELQHKGTLLTKIC